MDAVVISNMRIMRGQVVNVRAAFTATVSGLRLRDCFLLGKVYDDPATLRVCLPGKRDRTDSKWVASVECTDAALLSAIREKALIVYQGLMDKKIEKLADGLTRQKSGQIVASFLVS